MLARGVHLLAVDVERRAASARQDPLGQRRPRPATPSTSSSRTANSSPPKPGDGVARRARARASRSADLEQQLVAGGVAEAVVDRLEVVEVEEQHARPRRRRVRRAASACSTRSRNSARLARPVSGSWKAWWASCSSSALRSLTSRLLSTMPPTCASSSRLVYWHLERAATSPSRCRQRALQRVRSPRAAAVLVQQLAQPRTVGLAQQQRRSGCARPSTARSPAPARSTGSGRGRRRPGRARRSGRWSARPANGSAPRWAAVRRLGVSGRRRPPARPGWPASPASPMASCASATGEETISEPTRLPMAVSAGRRPAPALDEGGGGADAGHPSLRPPSARRRRARAHRRGPSSRPRPRRSRSASNTAIPVGRRARSRLDGGARRLVDLVRVGGTDQLDAGAAQCARARPRRGPCPAIRAITSRNSTPAAT